MRARVLLTLLTPLAAAAGAGFFVSPGDTGDLAYFVHSAERLLSGSWAETYSDPTLQVGPLQLLLFGILDAVAGLLGVASWRLIGAGVGALAATLFWVVARKLLAGRGGTWGLLAAALLPVALGLTFEAYRDGHPAQVLVPLLWVLAGLEVRAGRPWLAGALVGLAAGLELWGSLGVALFVLAPAARQVVRACAAAVAVAVLPLTPFVLSGDFGMFEYQWQVNGRTLLSLVVEPGTMFTWPLRVLQGAAALFAGALVATALRRSVAAVWAGPLVLVAVRLALDPVRYPWYWLALETLAAVGAVHLAAAGLLRSHARAWERDRVAARSA